MTRFVEVMRQVAGAVQDHADQLNRLDAAAGDGDLGVTAVNAARAVLAILPLLEDSDTSAVLRACGAAISREAPSTAGTLLATALLGAGQRSTAALSSTEQLAQLLDASRTAIAARGKAEPGWKTMLDALTPAAQAAAGTADKQGSLSEALQAASKAADEGATHTMSMAPRSGRAAWLSDRSLGHEDGGARLVAIILQSAAQFYECAE